MPIRLRPLDRQFARYCRTGDAEALGRVFDATAGELMHVAAWLAGNRADAEDLLQCTFLTAIEDRAAFASERRVLPWLMGILTNHARNLRREHARRRALPGPREPIADPIASARDAEFAAAIASTCDAIGAPYTEVLALHLEQGLNAKEIAERLGRPAGTVRTQVTRGLELLRQRLPGGALAALAPAVPLPPDPTVLAAIKGTVLTAARQATVAATARTAAVTTLATGGLIMSKKILLVVPAALLLLATGLYQGWFGDGWGRAEAATPPVASAGTEQPPPDTAPAVAESVAKVSEGAPSRVPLETPPVPADPGFSSLEVVVHWQHDGSPAAGVGVCAMIGNRGWLRRDGVTGADGRCSLGHLEPARWRVSCTHSDLTVAVDVTAEPNPGVEFTAEREATVRGSVVDAAGTSVADASIWIADGSGPVPRQFEVARSDARGWFVVPIRELTLLGARKPGHAESLAMKIDASKGDRDIVLWLRGAEAIVGGSVRDAEGNPVAWARVAVGPGIQLGSVGGPLSDLVQAFGKQAVTGADGTFAFTGVMPEKGGLWVWATGFAPHVQSLTPAAGQATEVDITMEPGAIITGTVHDAAGEPVAKARVAIRRYRRSLWLTSSPTTSSDENGAFELRDLPAGAMPVDIRTEDGRIETTTELQLVAGERTEWNAVLSAGRTIGGVILGPDDQPMPGIKIGFLDGLSPYPSRQETTDSRGRFTLTNVGDQPVTVEVGDVYHEPLTSLPNIAPDTTNLEVRIRHADLPTARIRGRLIDETGSGIAGVIGVPAYRGMKRIHDVTTDDLGAFDLGPMRPGKRMLQIQTKERGPLLVNPIVLLPDETKDLGTLTVPRPGSATFAVFDDNGEPVADARVFVSEIEPPNRSVGGTKIVNGKGRIDALPPGRWRVIATRRGLGPAEIEIQSDQTAHLELRPK